nr:agamous-like MADS-box protein AGL62 [Ipomoea trifida]
MSSRDTTSKRKSSGGATTSAKVEFRSWVPGNHISSCICVKWRAISVHRHKLKMSFLLNFFHQIFHPTFQSYKLLKAKIIIRTSHPSMSFTIRLHKSINDLAPLLLKLKYGLQARQLHVQLLDPCIPLSLNKLLRRQHPAAGLINRRRVVFSEKPLHHRLHSGVAEGENLVPRRRENNNSNISAAEGGKHTRLLEKSGAALRESDFKTALLLLAMAARTGRGRQRIEMVKIERKSNLEVTFSKRRIGLFKKASVLSTLCGADVGIIVFSPAGNKVFSFGHPSVEAVVERFLGEDNPAPVNETGGGALATEQFVEAQRNARVQELNMELTPLEAVFEFEKKKGEAIDGFVEANREAHGWMRGSYDDLSFQQLVTLKSGMKNLMKEIQQKAHHQLMAVHGNGTPFNPYASGVFPSGNMVPGNPTFEFNFGTNGGAAGALPFTSGVPGAHPFTSGGVAGALPFTSCVPGVHPSTSGSSSMAGGYTTVSPSVASTSGASNSAGGNLGATHAFF